MSNGVKCAISAAILSMAELLTVLILGTFYAVRDDWVPLIYAWLTVGGFVSLVLSLLAAGLIVVWEDV